MAVLKGLMKHVLERDAADLAAGGKGVLDREFIADHTIGFDDLRADLQATSWDAILEKSGLPREAFEKAGDIYIKSERVILCYGMGVTQHSNGTANVQQIANFLMLRGNMCREGAGICPLRGHSNVQGDRTVGITEKPPAPALLEGLFRAFGFHPPSQPGRDAVATVKAMSEGKSRALIWLSAAISRSRCRTRR